MTRRRSFGLLHLEDRLAPAVATWDGGGADNKWTTAANWVGDVAPQAGDDVDFPGGVAQKTAINDFATGTGFNSLAVYEAGYTIGGNAVTLTAGVTADVKFANNQFDSTLALPINGAGGLATTDGNLILAAANSYSGVTTVTAGVLTLQTNTALGATGAGNGTILDGGNIRLDADGLTVAEAFIAMPVSGNGGNGFSLQAFRRAGTLAGPITLGSFAFIGAPGVFSKLTVAGGVTETGGPQSLWVEGIAFAAGTTVAVTGTTTVNGDAAFDATGPTGPIRVMTGNISGSGTVGAIAPADPSGNYSLSPGPLNGPGTLTTAGLSANTSFTYFTFDLGVTTDRIVVNGSVHLGGQLETHFFPDFHPVVGQHYRLIDNDGTDAITGAFSNVVEGQLMLGGNDTVLRATYHGGTGNDFELIAEPAANGRLFAVGAGAGQYLQRRRCPGPQLSGVRSFLPRRRPRHRHRFEQ
jgi:autotransporter-associated beta strand protein